MQPPQNHWLADQLDALDEMASDDTHSEAFVNRVHALVAAVCTRLEVTSCVIGHEGLVVAASGPGDHEAIAAMAQLALDATSRVSQALSLGAPTQALIVGDTGKLVVMGIRDLAVAIQAPTGVDLATALSRS